MDGMRREAEREMNKQLRELSPTTRVEMRWKLARLLVAQAMQNLKNG